MSEIEINDAALSTMVEVHVSALTDEAVEDLCGHERVSVREIARSERLRRLLTDRLGRPMQVLQYTGITTGVVLAHAPGATDARYTVNRYAFKDTAGMPTRRLWSGGYHQTYEAAVVDFNDAITH